MNYFFKLKKIMREQKITQKYMGDLLGVDERTIRNYINGTHEPTIEQMLIIIDTLKISPNELFERTDNPEINR